MSTPTIRTENARLAYEQTKMLWDDEVAFAAVIREKRRTYSAGLAVLAAIGVFRLNWFRRADEVPIIADTTQRLWLQVGMIGIILVFLGSAYFLYTERRVLTPLLKRVGVGYLLEWLWNRLGLLEYHTPGAGGAANLVLLLDRDLVSEIVDSPSEDVWRFREARLRLAYRRLATANKRVNRRLRAGVLLLCFGYLLLMAFFASYTLLST